MSPTHTESTASPVARVDPRATHAALALVLVALLLLVMLPVLGERMAQPLHEEMREVAEPGRGHVTDLQLSLALEGAALRDFAGSGDTAFVTRYRRAQAMERAAREALVPLVRRLGPAVEARFDELRALQEEWHRTADEYLAAAAGSAGHPRDSVAATLAGVDLYEELLIAAARLDEAIDTAAQERRARILAAERLARRIALGLGLVALAAVGAVAWLGVRVRVHAVEAERRHRELERVVESRARLMRGVGHDLKNPLNAIDGHAALLADGVKGRLTPEQAASIGRIRTASRTLLSLIEDLLELARAESGQLRVEPRPVDLCALVRESVEEHRATADASRIDVRCDADRRCPTLTDPHRVRQVLGNLLSNAIKYTPPGGYVHVRAGFRRRAGAPHGESGARWAVVEVEDSGVGIPRDKLEVVFEEFSRLQPEAKPGAGLGLAIAQRVAHLLGGEITVESEPGVGSTFTLWLAPREGSTEEPDGHVDGGIDAAATGEARAV